MLAHAVTGTSMRTTKPIARIRITVIDPPPGVRFGVQRGRFEVADAQHSAGTPLVFEFYLTVGDAASEPVRFTGEFAQGPASARFVYINSGTLSGQAESPWTRRAKVPLSGVTPALLAEALAKDLTLATEIAGRAKDGGPACASVKLLSGWTLR
jgi:hypothetical protein